MRTQRRTYRPTWVVAVVGLIGVATLFVTLPAAFELTSISAVSAGYSPQFGRRESLLSESYAFVKGTLFLRKVSARLVRGKASDEERIAALLVWTHENVRPGYAAPDRVERDGVYDIVRRGFGSCDQSAHVFATLAHYAGYEVRLALLRKRNGVSPHTVAEMRLADRWIMVDPWLGVMLRDAGGKLLSVADFASRPELLREFEYANSRWLTTGDFRRATVLRTFPYQDLSAFLQKVRNRMGQLPVVPTVGAIRPATAESGSLTQVAGKIPSAEEIVQYDAARRAHLEGRYLEAVSQYEAVLETVLDRTISDSAHFFAALARLRAGQARTAINAFDRALKDSPGTPWRNSVLYYRAEAKESLGDEEGAKADLKAADVPHNQIRWPELYQTRQSSLRPGIPRDD